MMGMRGGGEQLALVGRGEKGHLGGGRCDGVVMVDRVPTIDEIDDAEKLEAYLRTRPVEEARITALRAAFRVMPFVANEGASIQHRRELHKKLALGLYRKNFTSWTSCSFSQRRINTIADKPLPGFSEDPSVSYVITASQSASLSADDRFTFNQNVHSAALAVFSAYAAYVNASLEGGIVWAAVRHDLEEMRQAGFSHVFHSGLWSGSFAMGRMDRFEVRFDEQLSDSGGKWFDVVWNWYECIRGGKTPYAHLVDRREDIIVSIVSETDEFWERDPDEVIREIFERLHVDSTTRPTPSEPEPGPGPQYDIVDEKLGIVSSPPLAGEVNAQTRLFERLRRDVERLVSTAHKIDNSHPNLAFSIREYAELMDTSLDALDVTGVWAVGGSLAGFAQSFREQNRNRTLAEPLEPEVDGLLQSVIRQHGAFIMGFEEGRDLVDRADRFALDTDRLRSLEESGNPLIAELASNADLVNDDARAVHKSISDVLHDAGWATARNGYTGFLIIQNVVRSIIKLTIGNEFTLLKVYGGKGAAEDICDRLGLPFSTAALTFLWNFGSYLLAFFMNFPEMHAYVQWALHIIARDRQLMQ